MMSRAAPSSLPAIRFLLRHARRRDIVLLLGLVIGVAVTDGFGVLAFVPVIARLVPGAAIAGPWNILGFMPSIVGLLAAMLALAVLRAALGFGKQVEALRLQNSVVNGLRARAFDAVIRAEWRWLVQRHAAEHADLIVTHVARVGLGLNQLLNAAALAVIGIAYLAAAFLLSWRLALLSMLLGAIVLALFATHRARTISLGFAIGRASKALHATIQQAFAGVRIIKAYRVEDAQTLAFARTLDDLNDQSLRNERLSAIGQALLQIGGAAALLVVLGIGHLVVGVPVSVLLPLLVVFARLAPMLGSLQSSWSTWNYALPAIIETEAFLAEADAAAEPRDLLGAPMRLSRSIELRDLAIRFAGRDVAALDDIALTLPANSTTALCGASGAGKSTLADVLMGLTAPDQGTVLVDGVALEGATRIAWRRSVAYVQQDPFLFHDTIRANIVLGRPDITPAGIEGALDRAGARFVLELPQGLDTVVGDGGVRLSGGERQRIALARALVASPALIILDEATSALDPDHEQAVRRTMAALRGEVTLVFISHRESMREDADQVVLLDKGRIVASEA